jgi:hypothetical protein
MARDSLFDEAIKYREKLAAEAAKLKHPLI